MNNTCSHKVMSDLEFSLNFADIGQVDLKTMLARYGIIHIRSVVSETNIRYFHKVISAALKSALKTNGITVPAAENDIDRLYNKLFSDASVTDFWKFAPKTLAKNTLVFHRLLCEPGIMKVAEELIGHDSFQLNWDQNLFRVDRPNEDFAAFEWHQDHPYILLSKSAVSVWSPLTDVTREMGPLKFVPGSHQGQFHPIIIQNTTSSENGNYQSKTSKHHYITLADRADLEKKFDRDAMQLPMKAGDALFFHSHLVHRSGKNVSDRSRWVFVARYGDLLDPEIVQRGWQSTRGANSKLVQELYPDRVRVARESD